MMKDYRATSSSIKARWQMKTCLDCKLEKPIEQFHSNKNKKDGRSIYCKECSSIRSKDFSKRFPGYNSKPATKQTKDYLFKYKHGIDRDKVLALIEEQRTCRICTTDLLKEDRDWVVDHDHNCCESNRSCDNCRRGFICQPCNKMLGFAKDNIETLQAAIKYLEEYKQGKIDANAKSTDVRGAD